MTAEWWTGQRLRFDLFTSQRVLNEAAAGDADAASRRLTELQGIPVLKITDETDELVRRFVARGVIPAKALEDAFHVAIATIHGMDYLLTWNCRHIVNAEIIRKLAEIANGMNYPLPVLCTRSAPSLAQLMGD